MNGASVESIPSIPDSTFGFIAARAARYPVMVRDSQVRIIRKESIREPAAGDPGIRWLLVNTLATDRILKETPGRTGS